MELLSRAKMHGGWVETYSHASQQTKTKMRFTVFVPPQAEHHKVPVLYWLSGLTCTDENFTTKAGAQYWAAAHGVMLVAPDTSPRGAGIEGEGKDWDFGLGAGFYVNATEPKWASHYRMYDYVRLELPAIIKEKFPVLPDRESVFGHSMGGHGALVVALREPLRFRSVSAFSPIVAPSRCPWGQKAFSNYLGSDKTQWACYDATELVGKSSWKKPILIDQGLEDKFLKDQLMPEAFEEACHKAGVPLELRRHAGYDHSYFFIASFIKDHIAFHAKALA